MKKRWWYCILLCAILIVSSCSPHWDSSSEIQLKDGTRLGCSKGIAIFSGEPIKTTIECHGSAGLILVDWNNVVALKRELAESK